MVDPSSERLKSTLAPAPRDQETSSTKIGWKLKPKNSNTNSEFSVYLCEKARSRAKYLLSIQILICLLNLAGFIFTDESKTENKNLFMVMGLMWGPSGFAAVILLIISHKKLQFAELILPIEIWV